MFFFFEKGTITKESRTPLYHEALSVQVSSSRPIAVCHYEAKGYYAVTPSCVLLCFLSAVPNFRLVQDTAKSVRRLPSPQAAS